MSKNNNNKLTLNIPPQIFPLTKLITMATPLSNNILIKLHLINIIGIHIINGNVPPVNTMDTAPNTNVAYRYPV